MDCIEILTAAEFSLTTCRKWEVSITISRNRNPIRTWPSLLLRRLEVIQIPRIKLKAKESRPRLPKQRSIAPNSSQRRKPRKKKKKPKNAFKKDFPREISMMVSCTRLMAPDGML